LRDLARLVIGDLDLAADDVDGGAGALTVTRNCVPLTTAAR
jgi:hypothetical protein